MRGVTTETHGTLWLACLHQVSAARVRLRRLPTYLIRKYCTSSSCAATPLRSDLVSSCTSITENRAAAGCPRSSLQGDLSLSELHNYMSSREVSNRIE
jgi:hypothetical protein